MGFFSDIVDGFTGKAQRKDLEAANAKATGALTTGRDNALGDYGSAQRMFDPYAQQGQKANALYADSVGANGLGAQQQAFSQYAGSDPFRAANQQYAAQADRNMYGARGWTGNSSLAAARASQERGATDWNNHLMRLGGLGQQGYQATASQAGLQQGMGDLKYGYGQQMAGNAINYGNAMAGTRNIGMQNIMGLGGLALGAVGAFGGLGALGGAAGGLGSHVSNNSVNRLYGGFGRSTNGGV